MTEQINEYIEGLENEIKETRNKLNEAQQGLVSNTMFSGNQDDNLIRFQLELDNILEKIEHLLRGDIVAEDSEGNVFYTSPKDLKGNTNTELQVLNEYGIQLVMNIISFYLNRNTILSNYSEERINEILGDLGDELADLIYCNYEKMGMDTPQKKSRYPMLVLNVLHSIESTYNRAYKGGERESLRSARVVTQNEPLSSRANMGGMGVLNKPKFSLFNPKTWG